MSGECGGAWLAERIVEAESVDEANAMFHDELNAAVNRIAFVSQCFTWVEFEPSLILRLNDNEDRRFYYRFSNDDGPVPLTFLEEEVTALKALETYTEKGAAFRCLREACIAPTFYSRMVMLAAALDALAAQDTSKKNWKNSRRDYVNQVILKDEELSNALYAPDEGIRHKLIHGEKVDWTADQHKNRDYVQDIYKAILEYFRVEHSITLDIDVVGPMRNPIGNYAGMRGWYKPRNPAVNIALRPMTEALQIAREGQDKPPHQNFDDMFIRCNGAPDSY